MAETIFEGMVNDVKYNDQTEWGKAIEECIKSGKSYTASSSIQIVNKTDDNSSSPDGSIHDTNTKDMFPLFNSTSTGLTQYLDAITEGTENAEAAVKSMDIYLDHCKDVISKKIAETEDQDWLYQYMNELDDISNSITNYDRANEAARSDLYHRKGFLKRRWDKLQEQLNATRKNIDVLSGKLDRLETVKEELKKIRNFYEDSFNKAYNKNQKLINNRLGSENKSEEDPGNGTVENESKDEFKESKDALHKLIEEIFGRDWNDWGEF